MKTLIVFVLLMWAVAAHAHKPSDSYLSLDTSQPQIHGQWDIALRDLDYAIGLDSNGDSAITWGEVRTQQSAIAAYTLARLHIEASGVGCVTEVTEHLVDHHSDGTYAVLRFTVNCPRPADALDVRYGLFFDLDPQHRGLLNFTNSGGTRTAVFSPDRPTQRLDLATLSPWRSVLDFWRDGVWHIWTGYDHILFLLTLLMPAVLRRDAGHWHVVPQFRPALIETLKIVTAFTLAHSITLSLAALGTVHLPSRLVESGIAASVVCAALNNTYPVFHQSRWLVGFGFGLLHGFGFASVLADPGLPTGSLLLALVGFNTGVEAGQLAIVGSFLPLAYVVRRSWFYQRFTLVVASSLIAVLAAVWFVERALDLRLLSS
ncbi:MAG: HupE/UreJ family protein [Deltaproteobacteria bacterium]|nr:HupE/UreJ family protein [Deltaproteobacteria bacterium]MBI3390139.1 HupE/UreJ family protein [Deltaproteobacteria bacterium]